MLLDADTILAGYPFTARRPRVPAPANASAVRAALDAARVLAAGDAGSEPAAVFHAFASYRRAFPGAWKQMAAILARAQARANGLRLTASGPELDALCSDVMHQRTGFDPVRAWFAARLTPLTP